MPTNRMECGPEEIGMRLGNADLVGVHPTVEREVGKQARQQHAGDEIGVRGLTKDKSRNGRDPQRRLGAGRHQGWKGIDQSLDPSLQFGSGD